MVDEDVEEDDEEGEGEKEEDKGGGDSHDGHTGPPCGEREYLAPHATQAALLPSGRDPAAVVSSIVCCLPLAEFTTCGWCSRRKLSNPALRRKPARSAFSIKVFFARVRAT